MPPLAKDRHAAGENDQTERCSYRVQPSSVRTFGMRKLRNIVGPMVLAVGAFALGASQVAALPLAAPSVDSPVVQVAADCYSIGQRVAAQAGGTLARASEANRGGQPVCVIVVLVPGKDGERPRRTEIVVPQG
jgi:hypothetical protein